MSKDLQYLHSVSSDIDWDEFKKITVGTDEYELYRFVTLQECYLGNAVIRNNNSQLELVLDFSKKSEYTKEYPCSVVSISTRSVSTSLRAILQCCSKNNPEAPLNLSPNLNLNCDNRRSIYVVDSQFLKLIIERADEFEARMQHLKSLLFRAKKAPTVCAVM
jgi:hypothetical protein